MKRPLIISEPVSEFGEATITQDDLDRGVEFREDMFYVPGFSDLRQQREREMAEYRSGTRDGTEVSPLPANCYWSRRTSPGGTMDAKKLMSAKNAGYRPVKREDIGKPWLTGWVDGWQEMPDGTIISPAGDCQLMVLEGQAAAKRAKLKQNKWLEQSGGVAMGVDTEETNVSKMSEISKTDKEGNKVSVVDLPGKRAKSNNVE